MLDRDKLNALIVWIANCPEVRDLGNTKLWKLLYFMDVAALRQLGHTITGSDYIKYDHGPVPSKGERTLKKLIQKGAVNSQQRPIGQLTINEILPVVSADNHCFNEAEMAIMKRVCHEMGRMSAKRLSEMSHQEPAWVYADRLGSLSLELMAYGAEEDPEGL